MSLFKKITESVSKGVSSATEKAQQTVEITRLYTQISGKRKEIDKLYAAIGELVYEAYEEDGGASSDARVDSICKDIAALRGEIDALDDRMKELRNEKDCVCARRVPYDTKFCPSCGHRFPEPPAPPVAASEPEAEEGEELPAVVAAEEAKEEAEPVICFSCGLSVEADARFCPACGHPADRFS
ncbi:zinc ribbon domain-containing protein [Cohnella faecalis]|uniref:Zinc-ribbon domain-containing protein n=1 Tax=Cohnella faecalis TaxID=2315694 RepID=A0A398CDI6_9BACL|nr:zinc ribbon domain-containing protein [Cohnella faecalis]RIE00763.1 zinc-ribbon domain-containing protein [Cohnella faecalis]